MEIFDWPEFGAYARPGCTYRRRFALRPVRLWETYRHWTGTIYVRRCGWIYFGWVVELRTYFDRWIAYEKDQDLKPPLTKIDSRIR